VVAASWREHVATPPRCRAPSPSSSRERLLLLLLLLLIRLRRRELRRRRATHHRLLLLRLPRLLLLRLLLVKMPGPGTAGERTRGSEGIAPAAHRGAQWRLAGERVRHRAVVVSRAPPQIFRPNPT